MTIEADQWVSLPEVKEIELGLREYIDTLLMAINALTERIEALEGGVILEAQRGVGHAS